MKTSPTFWLTTLINISTAFMAIAVVIFMTIPKEGRKEYFFLGAYLSAILLSQLLTTVGYFAFHVQMNLSVNVFEFPIFFMLVMLYKRFISIKHVNTVAYSLMAFHLTCGLINFFFVQGPFGFNSYTWTLSNALIVAMSLYYFYQLIKNQPLNVSLRSVPMFWVNLGILIDYSATFVIYIFEQYLVDAFNSNLILTGLLIHFLALIFLTILWYALLMIRSEYRNREYSI